MSGRPRGRILGLVFLVALGACAGPHRGAQHDHVVGGTTTSSAPGTAVSGAKSCSAPASLPSGMAVGPARLGAIDFLAPAIGVALSAPAISCRVPGVGVFQRAQPVRLASSTDGGLQWMTQGSPISSKPPTASTQPVLEQIVAVSVTTVWALSPGGTLLFTTDSGTTWAPQPLPEPVVKVARMGDSLWALACPPTSGSKGTFRCSPVLERKPLAGGAWETVPLPSLHPDVAPNLFVVSPDVVVLMMSDYGGSPGTLVVTADGGREWNLRASPRGPGDLCLSDASFTAASPSDWWLLCNGGAAAGSSTKALMRTYDGGQTWSTVSAIASLTAPIAPGSLPTAAADFMASGSASELWLAGFNTLTESTDGGVTWIVVPGVNEQGEGAGSFDVWSSSMAWLLAPEIGLWATTDGTTWHPVGPVTRF